MVPRRNATNGRGLPMATQSRDSTGSGDSGIGTTPSDADERQEEPNSDTPDRDSPTDTPQGDTPDDGDETPSDGDDGTSGDRTPDDESSDGEGGEREESESGHGSDDQADQQQRQDVTIMQEQCQSQSSDGQRQNQHQDVSIAQDGEQIGENGSIQHGIRTVTVDQRQCQNQRGNEARRQRQHQFLLIEFAYQYQSQRTEGRRTQIQTSGGGTDADPVLERNSHATDAGTAVRGDVSHNPVTAKRRQDVPPTAVPVDRRGPESGSGPGRRRRRKATATVPAGEGRLPGPGTDTAGCTAPDADPVSQFESVPATDSERADGEPNANRKRRDRPATVPATELDGGNPDREPVNRR